MTHYITRHAGVATLGDLECDFHYDADGDGLTLQSVKIGMGEVTPKVAETIMGMTELLRITDHHSDWWDTEGHDEALRSEADNRGDYLYEQARDRAMEDGL